MDDSQKCMTTNTWFKLNIVTLENSKGIEPFFFFFKEKSQVCNYWDTHYFRYNLGSEQNFLGVCDS